MNVLTFAELIKFTVPIFTGMVLARLVGLTGKELYQWEQIFFLQNAISFSYLWASAQTELTSVSDLYDRTSVTILNSLFGLISGGVLFVILFLLYNYTFFVSLTAGGALLFQIIGWGLENESYKNKKYRLIVYAISLTYVLTSVGSIIAFIRFRDSGLLVSLSVHLLIYFLRSAYRLQNISFIFNFSKFINLSEKTLLLGSGYLVAGLAVYVDGYLISLYLSETDFLLFRYGGRELPLSTVWAAGLSAALTIHISEGFDLEVYRKKIIHFGRVIVSVSVILLFISEYLFGQVYGERLSGAAVVFDGFLLLAVSRIIFPQSFILGLKYEKYVPVVSVIELMLHVIISWVGIHFLGNLNGIIAGTVFSFLFEKLCYIYILNKKVRFNYFDFHPFSEYILLSSALVLCYLLKYGFIFFRTIF